MKKGKSVLLLLSWVLFFLFSGFLLSAMTCDGRFCKRFADTTCELQSCHGGWDDKGACTVICNTYTDGSGCTHTPTSCISGAVLDDDGVRNEAACYYSITCPPACSQSCLAASSVTCGGSLDSGNSCSSGCTGTGTSCGLGLSCVSSKCVPFSGSLNNGLVSYWTFDDTLVSAGNSVFDLLGKNNGTLYGGAGKVSGIKGQAYLFDGINDYISVGSVSNFNRPPITISAWVKYTAVQAGGIAGKYDVARVSGSPGEPVGDEGYALWVGDHTGLYTTGNKLMAMEVDADINSISKSTNSYNDGGWHHVVGVFDSSSVLLYVDGSLISTTDGKNFDISWVDFLIGAHDSSPIYNPGVDAVDLFNGTIDEVVAWNRTLSASEVSQLYTHYIITGSVSPYWANVNGGIISKTNIGDTVRMVATGQGFDISNPMNYTVYKNLGWWFIKWVTPLSATLASSYWQPESLENNVYFVAKQNSIQNTSTSLNITAYDNSMPSVNIISPVDGAFFAVNSSIYFIYDIYDEDDLLQVTWNFGDGTNFTVYNYFYSQVIPLMGQNIPHNYSSGGIYTVALSVKEMNRTQFISTSRTIYVLQPGINILPIITSPNRSQVYTNWVKFNASQSFIVNCSSSITGSAMVGSVFELIRDNTASGQNLFGCSSTDYSGCSEFSLANNMLLASDVIYPATCKSLFVCLSGRAGNISQIYNEALVVEGFTFLMPGRELKYLDNLGTPGVVFDDYAALACKYIHAPGIKTTSGYNLTVTWNVKEQDGSNSAGFPISGKWAENYTDAVEFSRYFGTAAKRSATLVLDYSG